MALLLLACLLPALLSAPAPDAEPAVYQDEDGNYWESPTRCEITGYETVIKVPSSKFYCSTLITHIHRKNKQKHKMYVILFTVLFVLINGPTYAVSISLLGGGLR